MGLRWLAPSRQYVIVRVDNGQSFEGPLLAAPRSERERILE